jgi:hypothetical protein
MTEDQPKSKYTWSICQYFSVLYFTAHKLLREGSVMEFFRLNVADALHELCKSNRQCGAEFQGILAKQVVVVWSHFHIENALHADRLSYTTGCIQKF